MSRDPPLRITNRNDLFIVNTLVLTRSFGKLWTIGYTKGSDTGGKIKIKNIHLKIAIINGPNLNLLGKREQGIYGNQSFEDFFEELKSAYPQVSFNYYQSNIEGELINELQRVGFDYDGIIFNPGGYTHTSVAIGDAIAAIKAPVVEVHISNVHAREDFRKISHVSGKAVGSIIGLGMKGYALAVGYLLQSR